MVGALRPGDREAQAAQFLVDEVLDLFGDLNHLLGGGQVAEGEQAGAAVVAREQPERVVRRVVERGLVQQLQGEAAGTPEVQDEEAECGAQQVHLCSVYYRRGDGS